MASRFDPARRRLLRRSLAAGGLAAAAGIAGAARSALVADRPLTRIAFGSCCNQDAPQPIWAAINAVEPEVFVFLGDNIYGDTRDMEVLQAKYDQLAGQAGFKRLRERALLLATWDDHDYGENDAGADYPMKEESRRIFCDFWGVPIDSPRRNRDGIYEAFVIGPPGHRVQFILPDLRFNRTPLIERDLAGADYEKWADSLARSGKPVPGPYERNPASGPTMLGERQWNWLERQLAVPAELRILCSSLQVVADFPGWEAWVNFTNDRERLLAAIRRHDTRSLLCISGDTHYGELSMRDLNVPYPLWDLTSSGLTEVWPVIPPNAQRVGTVLQETNFGLMEIDWADGEPRVELQLIDARGQVRLRHRLDVQSLAART
jgi:alkaline phosphatase D